MTKARNLSLLSAVEAAATADQTKADIEGLAIDVGTSQMPSGSVLQIAESSVLVTSGVVTNTAEHIICSLAFTPKSATSKLIIEGAVGLQVYGNENTTSIEWRISLFKASSSLSVGYFHDNVNAGNTFHRTWPMYRTFKENSSNLNARTYHVQIKKEASNGRLNFSSTYGSNLIRVTEIEA